MQEAVESGVPVDCEATPEMLETIFFPNNAIHDGGVIIKGDRIAYAACIFPLTQRQDLNKSLGTRHRAAIGLSEETDAVIVVVSEETGMISHAYKGQLVRGVTLEELRAFLTSVLVQPAKSRSVVEWLRAHFGERHKPGPAVITKNEPRPALKQTGQLNFMPMRDWFIKGFRLEIVFADSGGGHLADRPQNPRGTAGTPSCRLPPVNTVTFTNLPVLIVSAAADVHNVQRHSRHRRRHSQRPVRHHGGACRQTRFTRS